MTTLSDQVIESLEEAIAHQRGEFALRLLRLAEKNPEILRGAAA
jgi:hypothetical protein